MKIIVTSDTHAAELPRALLEEIKKADCVIHTGDFTDMSTLEHLKQLKSVRAVYGNMDGPDLRQILPNKDVWVCEGVRIGITHGEGRCEGILERLRYNFKDDNVQVILFGHTHAAMNEIIDGVLFFNPGSPTDNYRAEYRSYGILEVSDKGIKGKIVKLK